MKRTLYAFTALALSIHTSGGCARHDDEPAEEPTGARAQALTDEVERARANPSGAIEAGSIEALLEAHADLELAIGGAGMPLDLDPFAFDADGACAVDASGASVDVSCASGGSTTGTITVDVQISEGNTYVHYAYDDVCSVEADTCVSGEGAVEVSSSGGVIVAGELTVTHAGETSTLKYGVTVAGGVEVVLWHDGASYVISTDAVGGLAVLGANGSWECQLDGEVSATSADLAGSCSLDGEIIDF